MAKISIFGLGYVGCVSAACLANDGHQVIGVDTNPDKVSTLNSGHSPIIEPQLAELIAQGVQSNFLHAIVDSKDAIEQSDLSFICVGTPSSEVGSLDLHYVKRVAEQIGTALRDKENRHTVVFRSTMLPGSMEEIVLPILEKYSGKHAGKDFGVCYNPEFLREGTAVQDFYEPPRTVIGQIDVASGDELALVYSKVLGPSIRTDLRTAEMVKYADNTFHALKIAFSNEIGNICKALGVDSHKVMEIFVVDKKLNLSPVYLKPGFAFGGSCLPKDLRAITHKAGSLDIETPVLQGIIRSNEYQKRITFNMIRRTGYKKVGVLGLSFKPDTDDLRESPAVELVETLLGKGYDVLVYDHNVSLSALFGSNRAYIDRELPHLSALLCPSLDQVLEHAEVLVITNRDKEFVTAIEKVKPNQIVLDLVRILADFSGLECRYDGICW